MRTAALLPTPISGVFKMIPGLQNDSNRKGRTSGLVALGKESLERNVVSYVQEKHGLLAKWVLRVHILMLFPSFPG